MSGSVTTAFPDHTIESAPTAARRTMAAVEGQWGYLPSAVARLAASPHALDGFLKLNATFESTTLDPLAREVLIMTMAARNGCHLCIAIHTGRLHAMGTDPSVIAALRAAASLPEPRLDAVRRFTLRVLETAGDVGDAALDDFLAHGFTPRNALEVVLGIATYTLSTLANRLTAAPIDPPLAQYA